MSDKNKTGSPDKGNLSEVNKDKGKNCNDDTLINNKDTLVDYNNNNKQSKNSERSKQTREEEIKQK